LNWWIAQHGVLAHHRAAGAGGDKNALRIPGDGIFVKNVASGGGNDANSEIVRGVRVAIPVCAIQPDPAVVSGDSNPAARCRR
jgi:hypothetical protein